MPKSIEALLPALMRRDIAAVAALFDGPVDLNLPAAGAIGDSAALGRILAGATWLDLAQVRLEAAGAIDGGERTACEATLYVRERGKDVELPVLCVADMHGGKLRRARLYHSTWPLTGAHIQRAPLLTPPQPAPALGPPVDAYEAALLVGDVEGIDALFEPDGYIREPAGGAYCWRGAKRLDFYRPAFSRGGVGVHICNATDDGKTLAFEYVCDSWGGFVLPPQAGAAVYERSPRGKLAAVRIYDDVSPPPQLFEGGH